MLVGNVQLVAGGREAMDAVLARLKKEGIETSANPDLYVRSYSRFGIDEARELRERASLKPFGVRRVFVIATPDINREAQNALLKTLEEPSADALFVFIVRSPETLLPTLRSRAHALHIDVAKQEHDAGAFLKATRQKRLDMLKSLLEKGADDTRGQHKPAARSTYARADDH